MKGEVIVFSPENNTLSYCANDLINFFNDKPINALILINPDNPSGNYITHDNILKLVHWAGDKKIKLILDESFVEFADINDTMINELYLKKYPWLVVIKSISKAYGIPGLRLGVLASGDEELVASVGKSLSIWNINSFAEFYLQICEKYKDNFKEAMELFYPVRDAMFEELKKIKFIEPIPSKANYIMCRLTNKVSSRLLTEYLLTHQDIFIKDLSNKNGIRGEYIRVAVKTPEENARLIQGIKSFLTHNNKLEEMI